MDLGACLMLREVCNFSYTLADESGSEDVVKTRVRI
jgi:hypothetical protein